MGELHLEIIRDRICTDFKVDATLGRLQVAYKESPQCLAGASAELDRWVGENRHTASCSLIVRPVPPEEGCAVEVEWGEGVSLPQSQHEVQKAVTDSITSACARGRSDCVTRSECIKCVGCCAALIEDVHFVLLHPQVHYWHTLLLICVWLLRACQWVWPPPSRCCQHVSLSV